MIVPLIFINCMPDRTGLMEFEVCNSTWRKLIMHRIHKKLETNELEIIWPKKYEQVKIQAKLIHFHFKLYLHSYNWRKKGNFYIHSVFLSHFYLLDFFFHLKAVDFGSKYWNDWEIESSTLTRVFYKENLTARICRKFCSNYEKRKKNSD